MRPHVNPTNGQNGFHNLPEKCFGDMREETLEAMGNISMSRHYPQSSVLFLEGEESRGIYILCSGRAKLSISSANGRSLMRLAEAGEILGLSATLSGTAYELTAEMLDGGEVNFIKRETFIDFLRKDSDASLRMAQQMSSEYVRVYDQIRTLALTVSVTEKIARLLLGWCEKKGIQTEMGIRINLALTHGEIAQMIGASRETVTRIFSDMKSRRLIQLKGSNLYVRDKSELGKMVKS